MRIEVTIVDPLQSAIEVVQCDHVEVDEHGLHLIKTGVGAVVGYRNWTRWRDLDLGGVDPNPAPVSEATVNETPVLLGDPVLDLPMKPNDADAETVRQYLVTLLSTLWDEGEGFSGKRPLGDSGWEWDLLNPVQEAGLIHGVFDEEGYVLTGRDRSAEQERLGRELIAQAILRLT